MTTHNALSTLASLAYEIDVNPVELVNPREDENLSRIIAFHKRYTLGDDHDYRSEDFGGWNELQAQIRKDLRPVLILPLYMYDHSALHFSVGQSFHGRVPQGHAEFDSGVLGFVVVTREAVKDALGWTRITPQRTARIIEYVKAEIAEYERYVNGWSPYEYILTDDFGNSTYSEKSYDTEEDARDAAQAYVLAHPDEFQPALRIPAGDILAVAQALESGEYPPSVRIPQAVAALRRLAQGFALDRIDQPVTLLLEPADGWISAPAREGR